MQSLFLLGVGLLIACGSLLADVRVTEAESAPAAASPTVETTATPAPVDVGAETGQSEQAAQRQALAKEEEARRASQPTTSSDKPALDSRYKVTKVHMVDNTETYQSGGNRGLEFEKKYWNHGAILASEKEARRGQIFVVSWKSPSTTEPLRARLEYRQVKSKEQVREQVIELPTGAEDRRATFHVVGEEYRKNGPVISWRFSLLRGDQVVAQEHSYIW